MIIQILVCDSPVFLAKNPSIWDNLLLNLATIIIALIAGGIALYQAKSNIVSSARIKWIEDLRHTIGQLYESTLSAALHYKQHSRAENNSILSEESYAEYLLAHKRYLILSNKVKMQLNLDEKDHKTLYDLICEIDIKLDGENILKMNQVDIEELLNQVVKVSRKIFKEEWDRSKKIFKI